MNDRGIEWNNHDVEFYSKTWFERWSEPLVKREAIILRRKVLIEKNDWIIFRKKYLSSYNENELAAQYKHYCLQKEKQSFKNESWEIEYNSVWSLCLAHENQIVCSLDDVISYYEDLNKSFKFLNTKIISWD
jgi:hypothetical protein